MATVYVGTEYPYECGECGHDVADHRSVEYGDALCFPGQVSQCGCSGFKGESALFYVVALGFGPRA